LHFGFFFHVSKKKKEDLKSCHVIWN